MGRRCWCAAIEIRMELHGAARQHDTIGEAEMMLAGADRAAVKRRDYRAAIVVVGGDVEDDGCSKHSQREFLKGAALHWKRQGSGGPAEPAPFSERRLARQQ